MTPPAFVTLLILGATLVGIIATAWDKLQVRRAIYAIENGADPGDIDEDTLAEIPERERQRLITLVRAREGTKSRQPSAPMVPVLQVNTPYWEDMSTAPMKPELFSALTRDIIHLILVGGSGAGKTTLTRALTRYLVKKGHRV